VISHLTALHINQGEQSRTQHLFLRLIVMIPSLLPLLPLLLDLSMGAGSGMQRGLMLGKVGLDGELISWLLLLISVGL
jgi:hypothetical protein